MILLLVQKSFIIMWKNFHFIIQLLNFGLDLDGKKCVKSRSMNKGSQGHSTTRGWGFNVKSLLCLCVPRVGYSGA